MRGLTIARGSADDIEALEPLWVAVHHRHVESMPELAPYVSDPETWIPDTWRTGERIVELESLSVLPGHRSGGVGTALLDLPVAVRGPRVVKQPALHPARHGHDLPGHVARCQR